MVLLDSPTNIKFLDEVIERLELDNISAIHGRAEDYGRDANYREVFDICIKSSCKAIHLSGYCLPFVTKGDNLFHTNQEIFQKSLRRLIEIQELGGKITAVKGLI